MLLCISLGYGFGSSWRWLCSFSLAMLSLGEHLSHFSHVQVLPTLMLLPIWPVYPLGRPSFHHLGLRSSGPRWTGQALASSLQALLSPQSSLKSHLSSLHLNSLFASSCMRAGSLSICIFWVPRMVSLTFAKQGLSLFCCSELGAATTVAVTGMFYQWLQPLGPAVCSVLWWFYLWVHGHSLSPESVVLCWMGLAAKLARPWPLHSLMWALQSLTRDAPQPSQGPVREGSRDRNRLPLHLEASSPFCVFYSAGESGFL